MRRGTCTCTRRRGEGGEGGSPSSLRQITGLGILSHLTAVSQAGILFESVICAFWVPRLPGYSNNRLLYAGGRNVA